MTADTDSILLSHIHTTLAVNPEAKQREIAAGMGLSLGMTNIVLRRFATKGWVLAKRLSARNIRYALTPDGMNELAHRSYHYMRRTFTEIRDCGSAVERCVARAKARGCTRVVLYGESDIAFIIEWAAKRAGLEFVQIPQTEHSVGVPVDALGLIGEGAEAGAADTLNALGCVSVYELAGREEILP